MTDGIANYAPITPDNLSEYIDLMIMIVIRDSSAIAKAGTAVAASVKAQSQGATVYPFGLEVMPIQRR